MIVYCPVVATATPSSLALLKSRIVYLSSAGVPRLSSRKEANKRVSVTYLLRRTVFVMAMIEEIVMVLGKLLYSRRVYCKATCHGNK